jgi:hypothetical protein
MGATIYPFRSSTPSPLIALLIIGAGRQLKHCDYTEQFWVPHDERSSVFLSILSSMPREPGKLKKKYQPPLLVVQLTGTDVVGGQGGCLCDAIAENI